MHQAARPRPTQQLSLGDFLASSKNSPKQNDRGQNIPVNDGTPQTDNAQHKRKTSYKRINPTAVQPTGRRIESVKVVNGSIQSANAFSGHVELSTPKEDRLSHERMLMKEFRNRNKVASMNSFPSNPSMSISSPTSNIQIRRVPFTPVSTNQEPPAAELPSLDKVSDKVAVDKLAETYLAQLNIGAHFNILQELEALFELLVAPCVLENRLTARDGFELVSASIHNSVYFATAVLSKCKYLDYLDRPTLQQLLGNSRVVQFSSSLKVRVQELVDRSSSVANTPVGTPCRVEGVSFQCELNSRSNFTNTPEFQVFCKQRDLFYGILRTWEQNHRLTGWDFQREAVRFVRQLFSFPYNCTNMFHLARLFISQMQIMCKDDNSCTSAMSNSCVEALKSADCPSFASPSRYKKLEERMVSSAPSIKPSREFNNNQLFFYNFIISASDTNFNQHLLEGLWYESHLSISSFIQKLDCDTDNQLLPHPFEHEFQQTLVTLCTFGKFLGYLIFQPYHSENKLSDDVLAMHIKQRKQVKIPVDLLTPVVSAIEKSHLSLTLPWVTEILRFMDPVSPHLADLEPILNLLVWIRLITAENKGPLNTKLSFMLRLRLEECFEHKFFPNALLEFADSEACLDKMFTSDLIHCGHYRSLDQFQLKSWKVPKNNKFHRSSQSVLPDQQIDIDSMLLYKCCPTLNVLKTILQRAPSVPIRQSKPMARKIKPILIESKKAAVQDKDRTVQMKLKDCFFHNQPSSVKKSIEFVGERLASNVVRIIRNKVIPEQRDLGVAKFQALLSSLSSDVAPFDKESFSKEISPTSQSMSDSCHQKCTDLIQVEIRNKPNEFLDTILPNDLADAVVETCYLLVKEVAVEKVEQWIGLHINPGLFAADYEPEFKKYLKSKEKQHEETTPTFSRNEDFFKIFISKNRTGESDETPCSLLSQTKMLISTMYNGSGSVLSARDFHQYFNDLAHVLSRSGSLSPSAEKGLIEIAVDFLFAIIVHHPKLLNPTSLSPFVDFCRGYNNFSSLLSRYLSGRNLRLLTRSRDQRASWDKFELVLSLLIKENLLDANTVGDLCVHLLRSEIPPEILPRLGTFLRNIVDTLRSLSNVDSSQFVELVEWVSWYFSQELNDFGDDFCDY